MGWDATLVATCSHGFKRLKKKEMLEWDHNDIDNDIGGAIIMQSTRQNCCQKKNHNTVHWNSE